MSQNDRGAMPITVNKFCAICSHLVRSMADLVVKHGHFRGLLEAVFRTIVLKIEDDHQCC